VSAGGRVGVAIRNAERLEIARGLILSGHNRTYAAKYLGVARRTLLTKIKQYGLTRVKCNELAGEPVSQNDGDG
jgi:DNA-binding NtrC family response regulator